MTGETLEALPALQAALQQAETALEDADDEASYL